MHHHRNLTGRSAFTLIELLVVVVIVVILAAIALPVMGRIQIKGKEIKTISNMRAMGVAFLAYAGDNNFEIPGRVAAAQTPDAQTPDRWPLVLQPYVQDVTLYGAPIPDVNGKPYKLAHPPTPYPMVYLNNNTNYTCYIYNGGNDAAPNAGGATKAPVTYPRLNVIGLPSQTILLGVPLPQSDNFYMDFTEGNNSAILNKAAFGDGTPYVFADGSVRTLSVDPKPSATSNQSAPISSAYYTDWLWLFDKSRTDLIQ